MAAETVGSTSLVAMIITLLICFGLPLILLIYFYVKERISIVAVLVGALAFLVSQVFIRIPILSVISGMDWYRQMAANLILIALFLSLTAGLFEEVARFLGFKFLLKKHLSWKNGIAFGIGHGGIEAIILTGFTYINNLVYSVMINTGAYDELLAPQLGPEMAQYIKTQLISLPPHIYLVAGFERAFTIFIHIALSLIVLLAVTRRNYIYLLYAILLHAAVNIPVVIIPGLGMDILYAELYLLLLAVFSIIFIKRSPSLYPELPVSDN
ncbi:MAG: YhfC family glutamic-type intramembrane protease [Bacillota bacterium]|nr:YhfC family glutamic-type intramembrane protease [Bacillota bacterium]